MVPLPDLIPLQALEKWVISFQKTFTWTLSLKLKSQAIFCSAPFRFSFWWIMMISSVDKVATWDWPILHRWRISISSFVIFSRSLLGIATSHGPILHCWRISISSIVIFTRSSLGFLGVAADLEEVEDPLVEAAELMLRGELPLLLRGLLLKRVETLKSLTCRRDGTEWDAVSRRHRGYQITLKMLHCNIVRWNQLNYWYGMFICASSIHLQFSYVYKFCIRSQHNNQLVTVAIDSRHV